MDPTAVYIERILCVTGVAIRSIHYFETSSSHPPALLRQADIDIPAHVRPCRWSKTFFSRAMRRLSMVARGSTLVTIAIFSINHAAGRISLTGKIHSFRLLPANPVDHLEYFRGKIVRFSPPRMYR